MDSFDYKCDNEKLVQISYEQVVNDLKNIKNAAQLFDLVDLYNTAIEMLGEYDNAIGFVGQIDNQSWHEHTPTEIAEKLRNINKDDRFYNLVEYQSFNDPINSPHSTLDLNVLMDYLIDNNKLNKLVDLGIDLNDESYHLKDNKRKLKI